MELPKPMGSLTTTINNTIATVQFSHPASNSFQRKLLDSLSEELNQLSINADVSVIVLRSEGTGAFVLGRL
jgi:methylglutaconyl-CoA hydratase